MYKCTGTLNNNPPPPTGTEEMSPHSSLGKNVIKRYRNEGRVNIKMRKDGVNSVIATVFGIQHIFSGSTLILISVPDTDPGLDPASFKKKHLDALLNLCSS
jgi:hypothetical protein